MAPGNPDPRALRRALGMFATGITIVTAADGRRRNPGGYVGLTVNSFASVSLDPPLVLWSLSRDNPDLPAFKASPHFAVNVLSAGQVALCRHFAHRRHDPFAGIDFELNRHGVPVFPSCCALFECRSLRRHDGGDHVIFIGRIEHFERHEREPLVFHGGHYHALHRTEETLD